MAAAVVGTLQFAGVPLVGVTEIAFRSCHDTVTAAYDVCLPDDVHVMAQQLPVGHDQVAVDQQQPVAAGPADEEVTDGGASVVDRLEDIMTMDYVVDGSVLLHHVLVGRHVVGHDNLPLETVDGFRLTGQFADQRQAPVVVRGDEYGQSYHCSLSWM